MMSQQMALPTPAPATQEDLTKFVFSDPLCLLHPSARIDNAVSIINLDMDSRSISPDVSKLVSGLNSETASLCLLDHTMSPATDTINRSLRDRGNASEAALQPEHQPQQSASEAVGQRRYKPQPLILTSVSQNPTDADLVDQAAAGNERAFELLVQRYETRVWQFVYHHLARTEDVQDIVQFVFLQLYLFLPRLQGHLVSIRSQQPLKSWLLQVARNRCQDELRKKQLLLFSDLLAVSEEESSPLEYLPDTASLPEEVIELQKQQEMIKEAIYALPSTMRAIVSLRYQEELTFREIGLRLGIPANTAKTYFQRARPLLRTLLASLREEYTR
jgi:RNA polymerase sigma-70 factor (ECF subfamily)